MTVQTLKVFKCDLCQWSANEGHKDAAGWGTVTTRLHGEKHLCPVCLGQLKVHFIRLLEQDAIDKRGPTP